MNKYMVAKRAIRAVLNEVRSGSRSVENEGSGYKASLESFMESSIRLCNSASLVLIEADMALEIADEMSAVKGFDCPRLNKQHFDIITQLRTSALINMQYLANHPDEFGE